MNTHAFQRKLPSSLKRFGLAFMTQASSSQELTKHSPKSGLCVSHSTLPKSSQLFYIFLQKKSTYKSLLVWSGFTISLHQKLRKNTHTHLSRTAKVLKHQANETYITVTSISINSETHSLLKKIPPIYRAKTFYISV